MKNGTCYLCNLPIGKKAIGTKLVFSPKCDLDGKIYCFKARQTPKDYAQEKGIDFEKAFTPTYCITTI